jgi:serine/threonine-protein kinase
MLPPMMAADPRGPLRVLGRYALYNEIAAGGMATVHVGRLLGPVGFARTVAIKRLHPQFAKDPEFVSGFLDEARLAARVQHPNVVATIDVVATDGELFLIMDYVRGESLSRLLRTAKKQGKLAPPRVAAAIMCGFLHGLHAAHEAKNERGEPLGLVHRDVSPQNVLVGSDGIARVLDFGVAKAAGRVQITRDGQIKGKLAYMPPEQLAGREITRAVDIYASAVVMWEALTGERLFKGENESETLAKILRDPVYAPSAIQLSVPVQFDSPILRALNRDPTKRHHTARELALELERCAGIASPTEVGEWVEGLVGPALAARETQIAEIESYSAGVSTSGRPAYEPDSSSDTSGGPLGRKIDLDLTPAGGFGASDARASSRRRIAPATPTGPTQPMLPVPPSSGRGLGAPAARGFDDTGSRSTGSQISSGSLALPVSRKVPVLATLLGLLVLAIIVGVVIAGKAASDARALAGEAPASSDSAAASATDEAPATAEPARDEIPPPAASASAEGDDAAQAGDAAAASASASASAEADASPSASAAAAASATAPATAATHAPTATPHTTTQHPTWRPAPAKPTSAPSRGSKCDPPYTIDSNGRKKYKLECM